MERARPAGLLHTGLDRYKVFDFQEDGLGKLKTFIKKKKKPFSFHVPFFRPSYFPYVGVTTFFLNDDPKKRDLSFKLINSTMHYANNGGYYREKSIKRLIDEMKEKKERYNLEFAYLVAESFLTTKRERIIEFIERYKEVDIPFWIEARPESINEENIKLLESSGCGGISLGIESGNLNLRKNLLGRNMTDETILKAFKILEKSSLRVSANNIIGFPTETREQIFETIDLNRQINVPSVMVSLYNPYKGTALREYCDEEGLMQKGAHAGDYRSEAVLHMPQISREQLLGLQRTFPLYVRFPKSEWPKIRKCEGNGTKAETLFKELSREYTENFYSNNSVQR